MTSQYGLEQSEKDTIKTILKNYPIILDTDEIRIIVTDNTDNGIEEKWYIEVD